MSAPRRTVVSGQGMRVKVQYFDGCPNWRMADERLRAALREVGHSDIDVTYEVVGTTDRAEAIGFRGSPTILLDGVDPFADPNAGVGLTCRLFATDEGLAGAPTVEQMVRALRSAIT